MTISVGNTKELMEMGKRKNKRDKKKINKTRYFQFGFLRK